MAHAAATCSDCCVHLKEMPSRYPQRLHFDTIVFSTEQLKIWCANMARIICCWARTIPTTSVIGDPIGFIESAKLDSLEARAVMGENAGRLLKIEAPLNRPVR